MFKKLKNYIQESRLEFKRVNWPTKRETVKMTWTVIGLSLGLAIFLGLLDLLFHYLLANFLL